MRNIQTVRTHGRKVFLVALFILFAVPSLASAGFVGFSYEHNFSDPRVCGFCQPVGQLEMLLDIPASVVSGSSITINFSGIAVEPLYQVPICPTVKYGNNGVSSMPGSYSGLGCWRKNDFITTTGTFIAPNVRGTYQFCAQAGINDTVYSPLSGVQCVDYTVVAGTIDATSNIAGGSYTLTGPATLNGGGTSTTFTDQPLGTYTITWNAVSGYITPASSSQTLTDGGTISFSGNYGAPTVNVNFSQLKQKVKNLLFG